MQNDTASLPSRLYAFHRRYVLNYQRSFHAYSQVPHAAVRPETINFRTISSEDRSSIKALAIRGEAGPQYRDNRHEKQINSTGNSSSRPLTQDAKRGPPCIHIYTGDRSFLRQQSYRAFSAQDKSIVVILPCRAFKRVWNRPQQRS